MRYVVLSVKDLAAEVYAQPFCAPTIGHAVRSFTDAVNAKPAQTDLARHPDDFELFVIAFYDDVIGGFIVDDADHLPRRVARGKEVRLIE